ncbi:hypothetical protein HY250_04140 [Candidatus Azambacteria bacterium]|nr:hypothetical protein [Candidatus Azambacteria bacterium]
MKLRGVDFGPVWTASGTLGFYGEGYPYQKALYGLLGWCDFDGATLVAKTVTLKPRDGNMRLNSDGSLPWWPPKPACIVAKLFKGAALNAIGLSNLGAEAHFADWGWQRWEKPFFISFAAMGKTREERMRETREFVGLFKAHLPYFRSPVGIQWNDSCPNTTSHAGLEGTVDEMNEVLAIGSVLGIPQVPKFSVMLPPYMAVNISRNPQCDAVCVSNTIPWGKLPDEIDWAGLFGSEKSPLERYGGGGLSGKPLLSLVADWIQKVKRLGIGKPINAGGGILKPDDVDLLVSPGASSIFLGSISFLRPYNVKPVIARAHRIFDEHERRCHAHSCE